MMSGNIVFIMIGVIIGGAIMAVIAYYTARFSRGSIKLSLPVTAYNPGDTIIGSFDLITKKPMQSDKLSVSLIGIRVITAMANGEADTNSAEIYSDEILMEKAKEYPAGFTATYNFSIRTPNLESPELVNSPAGRALSAAVSSLNNNTTELKWVVEARLDVKGVDLATKQPVTINMGSSAESVGRHGNGNEWKR